MSEYVGTDRAGEPSDGDREDIEAAGLDKRAATY